MIKRYEFQAHDAQQTQKIGYAFGSACEAARPRGEVWNIALHGGISMGKTTFAQAFTKAVFSKNWDVPSWNIRPYRSDDIASHWSKKQVRHNDYMLNNGHLFYTPRKPGFGGYDMLEHAPKDFAHIARVNFFPAYRSRLIALHLDQKIWDTLAFKQAAEKFQAREFSA